MATNTTCPRCGHQIPNDRTPGAYPGAMSRYSSEITVCSACGGHEAMLQFTGHTLTGPEDWPVEVPEEFYALHLPSHQE